MPKIRYMIIRTLLIKRQQVQQKLVLSIQFPPIQMSAKETHPERKNNTQHM